MSEKVKKKPGKVGYIFAVIFNIAFLYVFNNLLNWGVPFLTQQFSGVLWAINLSIGASIIVNALWIFYDAKWFRHLGQIVLNALSLFAAFMIFAIFPFTFGDEPWAIWVKVGLIIVMVGTGIGSIVELVKLVLGKE